MDDARRPDTYNALRLSGSYEIVVRDRKSRKVLETRKGRNLVTTVGEALTAKLLDPNGSSAAPEWIAFGQGADGAQKSDTQLQLEIAASRVQADSSAQSTNTMRLLWDIEWSAGTKQIGEVGIFNASVAGTMMARFLTQALGVTNGVDLAITWTLTISGVD